MAGTGTLETQTMCVSQEDLELNGRSKFALENQAFQIKQCQTWNSFLRVVDVWFLAGYLNFLSAKPSFLHLKCKENSVNLCLFWGFYKKREVCGPWVMYMKETAILMGWYHECDNKEWESWWWWWLELAVIG